MRVPVVMRARPRTAEGRRETREGGTEETGARSAGEGVKRARSTAARWQHRTTPRATVHTAQNPPPPPLLPPLPLQPLQLLPRALTRSRAHGLLLRVQVLVQRVQARLIPRAHEAERRRGGHLARVAVAEHPLRVDGRDELVRAEACVHPRVHVGGGEVGLGGLGLRRREGAGEKSGGEGSRGESSGEWQRAGPEEWGWRCAGGEGWEAR